MLDPQPEDLDLFEIASGLSREARYGAACTSEFWSVAQHSLAAEEIAVQSGLTDQATRRVILMHDAPEYMLRDMIRPVKQEMPDYARIESIWWRAIASRFDLPEKMPSAVKVVDNWTCGAEKAALISAHSGPWEGIDAPFRLPKKLLGRSMDSIRDEFLGRCRGLGIQ